jgi:hypothetical protein
MNEHYKKFRWIIADIMIGIVISVALWYYIMTGISAIINLVEANLK